MHSFAPEIILITILGLVVFSDALTNRFKIPSVFLLLIGSYTIYTYIPMAVPIDLKLHLHMIPASFEYKEFFEVVTTGVVMLSIFVYGTVLWGYFTFIKKEAEPSIFKK